MPYGESTHGRGGEPGNEANTAFATTYPRETNMMDGMMMDGGWGMMAICLVALVFFVLGIAAFAKYLFWSKR